MTQQQWDSLAASVAEMSRDERERLLRLVRESLASDVCPGGTRLWGLFADDEESLNEVVRGAYEARQSRPARVP